MRTALTSSDAVAYAIADNRSAELAEWDDDVLAATLNGLATDDAALLEAAGFTEAELENLRADEVDDPSNEWSGMPEFENSAVDDIKLTVYFATAEKKVAFAKQVNQTVTEDTKFVWFPASDSPKRQDIETMVVREA